MIRTTTPVQETSRHSHVLAEEDVPDEVRIALDEERQHTEAALPADVVAQKKGYTDDDTDNLPSYTQAVAHPPGISMCLCFGCRSRLIAWTHNTTPFAGVFLVASTRHVC
jgi:hypothetical protein